ncbi:MAG: sugar-binding protein [Salinivirgaceae bacterium]
MRKLLSTLLMALALFSVSQAQTVIFDPATYTGLLPNKMSIVDIDGTKYLQVIVDGWNSTLNIPEVETVLGTQLTGYVRFRQGTPTVEAGLTLDKIVTAVQVMDTVHKVPASWNPDQMIPAATTLGGSPSQPEFTFYKKDLTPEMTLAHQIQFFGQEMVGWGPTTGDTIWVGKVATVDATVLFDPATIDVSTLPDGMEVIEIGGVTMLKVTVDGWNTNLPIAPFETGKYNKVKMELAYGQGTSTVAPVDANVFVQAMVNGSSSFSGGLQKPTDELTVINSDAKPNVTVDGLQIAVQDMANGWNAVVGAEVYIGKIVVWYYELVLADPLNTANVNYTNLAVEIDGLYDDAFEASTVNKVNRVALGTVNGVAAAANAEVTSNNDSYGELLMVADMENLYIYLDVTDDDPLDLGTSTQPWMNDGVELFMDVQDRRYLGSARISGEQHQSRFNVGTEGPAHGNDATGANALGMDGFFGINDTTNINFAIIKGSLGFSVEIAVPWVTYFRTNTNTNEEALVLAEEGLVNDKKIGFEFSLIDASAPDTRKSILNWANNTGLDKAYTSPEFWGQLTLKGFPTGIIQKQAVSNLTVYPNPANNQLTVDMVNLASVEIYNLLGAKVVSLQMSDNRVDVSTLNSGVYVVKATDTKGQVAVTKFNKK